jgi:L-rhamnose mutarotase
VDESALRADEPLAQEGFTDPCRRATSMSFPKISIATSLPRGFGMRSFSRSRAKSIVSCETRLHRCVQVAPPGSDWTVHFLGIFRRNQELVLYMKVSSFDSFLTYVDNSDVDKRWQQNMVNLFVQVPSLRLGERFAMMEEVFHMTKDQTSDTDSDVLNSSASEQFRQGEVYSSRCGRTAFGHG